MTGIVTTENSFYMRTTLYPPEPRRLRVLFETPSRWLTPDWQDAQHLSGDQKLRCLWSDGTSAVTFHLAEIQPGCFRLDASFESATAPSNIGSIANACSIANQRFRQALEKEAA